LRTRRTHLRKKPRTWRIEQVSGPKVKCIGTVAAPDQGAALKKACEKFGIVDLQHQRRLVVREL